MRLTEVRGRAVIDPVTARKIGTIEDVFIEPPARHIAAIRIVGADGPQLLPASRIARFGQHAVMLKAGSTGTLDAPDAEWLNFGSAIGLEVLNDSGDRIGVMCDLDFDPVKLEVQTVDLEVRAMERWFGGGGRIGVDSIVSGSRELMVVHDKSVVTSTAMDGHDERLVAHR